MAIQNHTNNLTNHVANMINRATNIINHDNVKTTKITEVEKFSKNHDDNMVNHDSNIIKHTQKTNGHVNVFKNLLPYIPAVGMLTITGLVTTNLRTLPSDATSADVNLAVSASCSFTGVVDSAHTTNLINGQYKADIGNTILRTFCNDANGYEIYAVGISGEVDESGNDVISTDLIDVSDPTHLIATGLYPGTGNVLNSTPSSWSMKLSACTSSINSICKDDYLPTIPSTYNNKYALVPSKSTLVASYPSSTAGSRKTDSSLTSTYDAFINQLQPAGTYVGHVKYTMLQTAAYFSYTYNITLNANGGVFSNYTTNPTATTKALSGEVPSGTSVSLSGTANTSTRTGYTFLGWCNTSTTDDGTKCNNSTTPTYTGSSAITITGDTTTTLYAVWGENRIYMQDVTVSDCTTTARTAYDSRDESSYIIQRLADNKCWMLDNLRLGSTSTTALTRTNSNTNGSYTLPASTTSGFYTGTRTAKINASYKNDTATNYGAGSGKIGVYYNYCAASAGTVCAGSDSGNAQYDICPKGWRMPTGGPSGEYQALYSAYNSDNASFLSALSASLSGGFWDNQQYNLVNGFIWSSTYYNSVDTYRCYFDASQVYAQNAGSRGYAYPVRCLLK